MTAEIISKRDIHAYIEGALRREQGFTIITLQGIKSRFTYRLRPSNSSGPQCFVDVLSGPNNETDYQYICYLYERGENLHVKPRKPEARRSQPLSMLAFDWFIRCLNSSNPFPIGLYVYHDGRCSRCGRILTTPDSVKRGLGPVCASRNVEGQRDFSGVEPQRLPA